MKNKLAIICSPGGYYNYVRIGWVRRVAGDEFEMVGARVVRRFGSEKALAELAAEGPAHDTQLLVASVIPAPLHRLDMKRIEICLPEKWAKDCPKPKDWVDE